MNKNEGSDHARTLVHPACSKPPHAIESLGPDHSDPASLLRAQARLEQMFYYEKFN